MEVDRKTDELVDEVEEVPEFTLLVTEGTGDATPTAPAPEKEFELVTVTYGNKLVSGVKRVLFKNP